MQKAQADTSSSESTSTMKVRLELRTSTFIVHGFFLPKPSHFSKPHSLFLPGFSAVRNFLKKLRKLMKDVSVSWHDPPASIAVGGLLITMASIALPLQSAAAISTISLCKVEDDRLQQKRAEGNERKWQERIEGARNNWCESEWNEVTHGEAKCCTRQLQQSFAVGSH